MAARARDIIADVVYELNVHQDECDEKAQHIMNKLAEKGFIIVPVQISHEARFKACQALQEERNINIPASAMVNVWNAFIKQIKLEKANGN